MTVRWRIWLSFGMTFFLLLTIAVIGNSEAKRVRSSERWVTHAHTVIAKLDAVTSELKDAETGQRGFLLTTEEAYLRPYNSALGNVPARLAELSSLLAENPKQQQQLLEIHKLVADKLSELDETIQLHRAGRTLEALAIVRTSRGQRLMNEIRLAVKTMRADEYEFLEYRKIESDRAASSSTWIIYGGSIFTLMIAALVAFLTSRSITRDYVHLQSTKQSLAIINQELQNFVYRTSHDFKSPVLGIKSMTQFIEEDLRAGDIDEALENIGRIRKNADALEKVVNSTLQLAKTDLSDNRIEPVNLGALIVGIGKGLAGSAKARGVEFTLESGFENLTINTDPNHLTTILENLISNSIKYSDENNSRSFVIVDATAGNNHSVEITIKDNGIGIPEKRQTEVFGMFKQFHPDRANGTGLGMYIVKKSVERLNGTISFDSSDKGTRFCISLPDLDCSLTPSQPD